MGVAAAARQLSLHDSQIYGWRNKAAKKDTSTSQREKDLAKLKRQLAKQAEELDIV